MEQTTPNLPTKSADNFLIAEYQSVLDRSLKFEEVKANRINFYLFLVGAVMAGFGSLVGVPFVQENIYVIGIGTALFLSVLGWQTLMHSVQFSMAIISLYRISGRTRKWIFDQNPSVLPYLAFEPADNKPSLMIGDLGKKGTSWGVRSLIWRGGEPILLTINSVLMGLVLCLILMWILSSMSVSFETTSVIGIIFLLIGIMVTWRLQVLRLKEILSQRNIGLQKREFFPMTRDEYNKLVNQTLGKEEE